MSARIPKRLAGPIQLASSTATIYTAPNPSSLPTGMIAKAYIKHIHLSNPTANARTVTMSITADAASKRILDAYTLAAGTTKDDFPMYVLEAGEIIAANADAATAVVCVIDGEEVVLGG